MADRDVVDEALQFFRLSEEALGTCRSEWLEDLRFVSGDQWPVELQNSRLLESRPCLTINKLDSFARQICNQQRQQRPRIRVHGINNLADKKVADVLSGLIRHIEVNSNADTAYDNAFDSAVKIGIGYWRIRHAYVREDSFDQEIFIDPVANPFSVYMDPNSQEPDGADQHRCLITERMSKASFRRHYPGADEGQWTEHASGDSSAGWVEKEDIRVAEYFEVDRVKSTLVQLSSGDAVWKDEMPDPELLDQLRITVVGDRPSWKRRVMWRKLTSMEVLEEKVWPGRFIPVVPVYGNVVVIDGKRKIFGIVKFAKDPQRMVNYWETAATESIALAPKAKWLLAEGQDEGHENEWARANQSATAYLRYKQTDLNGQPAPPPQRLQPEPPPAGILEQLQVATSNMREVLGVVDPAMRISGNVSGKALQAEKIQSDISTFHYYDNLTRSIAHTGRIILDLVPKIYDTERMVRIIGDDGRPDMIVINGRKTTAEDEIENDVTVGLYDVTMQTGPGFDSKRQEALAAIAPLMQNEELFKVMGDLFFRNSDFPGSEVIADRLAAINPLAQIDEKSDVPPAAQMLIKQLQQQLQAAQQQLQQAGLIIKTRADVEQMRQQAETQRELMRQTTKAHDVDRRDASTRRDVEMRTSAQAHDTIIKTQTQLEIERMKTEAALILAQIDRLERRGAAEETEERAI